MFQKYMEKDFHSAFILFAEFVCFSFGNLQNLAL